ncbi:hypothetical protein OG244_04275 [Streptomyces brevispora]|uniref:DUF6624 domain-containing protein n=1 Tax=Streptomyces brevispora TaxID=887462 RepID=UPI002E354496|nr:DUF6624 domain-containing protein [Streptomyces brevispora]
MSTDPLHPHLARELVASAKRSDEHWARLARISVVDQQVGAGRHTDHVNAGLLAQRMADYGWPDVPLVGEGGARAAWRIALRADTRPDLQRLASRLMYGAVERGTASLRQWAHLYDRCLLNSRRPQYYGTQYCLGPGGPQMQAVSEPTTDLDIRRAAVSLPPAAPALHRLRERLAAEPLLGNEEYAGTPVDVLVDMA